MATKKKAATPGKSKSKTKSKSRTTGTSKPAAPGREVWRLKVKLERGAFAEGPWSATVDAASTSTLEDLHRTILKAVSFEDDHMHTFYIARTDTSRDRIALEDEMQEPLHHLKMEEIFPLPKDRKLFYWFDFGDDWIFSITRAAESSTPTKGARYPSVITTQGRTPKQYPDMDE